MPCIEDRSRVEDITKSSGVVAAKLNFMGHVLMENQNGFGGQSADDGGRLPFIDKGSAKDGERFSGGASQDVGSR